MNTSRVYEKFSQRKDYIRIIGIQACVQILFLYTQIAHIHLTSRRYKRNSQLKQHQHLPTYNIYLRHIFSFFFFERNERATIERYSLYRIPKSIPNRRRIQFTFYVFLVSLYSLWRMLNVVWSIRLQKLAVLRAARARVLRVFRKISTIGFMFYTRGGEGKEEDTMTSPFWLVRKYNIIQQQNALVKRRQNRRKKKKRKKQKRQK